MVSKKKIIEKVKIAHHIRSLNEGFDATLQLTYQLLNKRRFMSKWEKNI